jgi:hypothetical protein
MTPIKKETPDLDLDAVAKDGQEVVLTFKLADRVWHVRSGLDLPWDTLEKLLGDSIQDPSRGIFVQMAETAQFFNAVIIPSELDAWKALGDQGLTPRQAPVLMKEIGTRLFAKRPTRKPSSSSAGRKPTSRTGAASSSGRVTAPKRSVG